jgi:hypothetical protein
MLERGEQNFGSVLWLVWLHDQAISTNSRSKLRDCTTLAGKNDCRTWLAEDNMMGNGVVERLVVIWSLHDRWRLVRRSVHVPILERQHSTSWGSFDQHGQMKRLLHVRQRYYSTMYYL